MPGQEYRRLELGCWTIWMWCTILLVATQRMKKIHVQSIFENGAATRSQHARLANQPAQPRQQDRLGMCSRLACRLWLTDHLKVFRK
jgi:hypothetical protein